MVPCTGTLEVKRPLKRKLSADDKYVDEKAKKLPKVSETGNSLQDALSLLKCSVSELKDTSKSTRKLHNLKAMYWTKESLITSQKASCLIAFEVYFL